ncbi:acyl-coenzyme A thioesterase 1-like [Lytechinus pictus]|uniref:acyl-coenzyme A thioesterase 1-like n=1 Tax=Lytechinus pictus TaxID=7653 RepID=UPI0030B9E97E
MHFRNIMNIGRKLLCDLRIHKVKQLTRHFSCNQIILSSSKLHVCPRIGLSDECLDIRANGLAAGQTVELRSTVSTECGRFEFEAHAQYTANEKGEISVNDDPSEGGTYAGIEPMGLLSRVQSLPVHAAKYPRIYIFKPTNPLVYTISMYDIDSGKSNSIQQEELDSVIVERHFVAPYVEHSFVECGGAMGTLYLPKKANQSSPVPLVIEMPGLGPTFARDRFPLLASHGFGVFEFDYFQSLKDDLQKHGNAYLNCRLLIDIIEFARTHPDIDENRIGLNGTCYGGTLALNAVSRIPDLPIQCLGVQRCVDFLATHVGLETIDGNIIEPAGPPGSYTRITKRDDGEEWFEFDFNHKVHHIDYRADCIPPVEDISIPTMLLVSGDDQQCASEKCLARVASRIHSAGKSNLLETHYFEGAGHLLDSPYFPLCRQSKVDMPNIDRAKLVNWGGDPALHARALVKSWQKTISFYRRHLRPEEDWRQDWHE